MLFYAITVTLYEANTTFTVKRFHPTVLSTSMEKHPLRLTITHYLITNAWFTPAFQEHGKYRETWKKYGNILIYLIKIKSGIIWISTTATMATFLEQAVWVKSNLLGKTFGAYVINIHTFSWKNDVCGKESIYLECALWTLIVNIYFIVDCLVFIHTSFFFFKYLNL